MWRSAKHNPKSSHASDTRSMSERLHNPSSLYSIVQYHDSSSRAGTKKIAEPFRDWR